jgi:glycosyltransferase involved in cell wall biosynthesis
MLKIVHFAKYYSPIVGGIESVTRSLARAAVIYGHEVSVICFDKRNANLLETVEKVLIIRNFYPFKIFSQPLSFFYFYNCIKRGRATDIIHLHYPNLIAALAVLFIGRKSKLVVHWHSDIVNKGILSVITHPMEWVMLRRANQIIVTSSPYYESSASLKKFASKVEIVPIGIPDVNQSKLLNCNDISSFNTKSRKVLLSVGRLVNYKGFDILIEAARYINKEAVIVIVGDGPMFEALQKQIVSLGLTERVFLLGRLKDEELNCLFSQATLYCLPSISRAEAFGVVLLEAMAHGLPIVATNILGSGVPWVNLHGESGINVRCNDPLAFADACNMIISSKELRTKLSFGARNRYVTKFNEEISSRRVMEIYNNLIVRV